MNGQMNSVEEIFLNAREIAEPAARAAFVSEKTANDPTLRDRVEALLQEAESAQFYFGETRNAAAPTSVNPALETPGEVIGRYKLLQKIGEGGMGVVYMAEQREPVIRKVALKIIKLGMDTREVVGRFEAERQALALMDHPNIAKVLDGGATEHGRPYFVMELVQGLPITRFCDEAKLSTPARLSLFLEVCAAIQHAHQKGIIHRDIKPSNILVTYHGDRPVPKVIDFGIAKATQQRLTDKTVFTQFQHFIGTPAYMSPEQASLSGLDIDTRSDIYGLGVLLYELLTGRTPFDGGELLKSGIDEMRRAICEREPPRPSTRLNSLSGQDLTTTAHARCIAAPQLIHLLRGDLDWIVMKCLEKDRSRRYATANGLALDLQRHLNNEAVTARPPSAAYRFQKAFQRNKLAFAAVACVLFALLAGIGATSWQSALRHRALMEARRTLYVAQMQSAQQAWERGDVQTVRNLLRANLPKRGEEDLRGFEWRYFGRLSQDQSLTFGSHLPSGSKSVAISSDGKLLAWGDLGGRVELCEIADWRPIASFTAHQGGGVFWLEFSRDGKQLISAGGDRAVRVWDVATQEKRASISVEGGADAILTCARLSPDGTLLAIGGYPARTLHIVEIKTGEEIATFQGLGGDVRHAAFSPDGRILAMNQGDHTVQICELASKKILRTLEGHRSVVGVVEYSPDGKVLATSEANGVIKLWHSDTWNEAGTLFGHRNVVMSLVFSPDGQTLASACRDGVIRIWNVRTKDEFLTLRGHSGWVNRLAFFPDGRRLASTGDDQKLRIWDIPGPEQRPTFAREAIGSGVPGSHAEISPDGQFIVTLAADKPVRRVWRANSGELVWQFPGGIESGAFSNDSRLFAAGGGGSTLQVWSLSDGREVASFSLGTNRALSVAFKSNEEVLAAVENENLVRRWHVQTRQSRPSYTGFEGGVNAVKVSANGRLLAVWCRDGNIHIRDLQGEKVLPTIPHESETPCLEFSPDDRWLAVFSGRLPTIRLWNPWTGELLHAIESSAPHYGATFSPDGKLFAYAAPYWKPGIKIFDISKGKVIADFQWSGGPSWSMAFSPDLRSFAIADTGGAVRLWSLPMQREVVVFSMHGSMANVRFSRDGNVLVTHNLYRNNLLLHAASIEEIEADLRAPDKGMRLLSVAPTLPSPELNP